MNTAHTNHRIHPLIATAAVSVTLLSLLGISALTGVLPTSRSATSNTSAVAGQTTQGMALTANQNPVIAIGKAPGASAVHHASNQSPAPQIATAQTEAPQHDVLRPVSVAQKQAPVPQNSPIGIGVGAVIGGLLGNQVGSGDGKTLATIAGAVGGGYIGNEVAKRNP
jgi:uncharacterized protein YcfJ